MVKQFAVMYVPAWSLVLTMPMAYIAACTLPAASGSGQPGQPVRPAAVPAQPPGRGLLQGTQPMPQPMPQQVPAHPGQMQQAPWQQAQMQHQMPGSAMPLPPGPPSMPGSMQPQQAAGIPGPPGSAGRGCAGRFVHCCYPPVNNHCVATT